HLRPDPRSVGEAARPRQGRGDGQDRRPVPGRSAGRRAERRRVQGRRLARRHSAAGGCQGRAQMSRKPAKPPAPKPAPPKPAAKVLEAAARPVEVVGQTLERAFDPLASALKRAALKRAERQAQQFAAATPPPAARAAKGAMPVSPLAVPFPKMPPVAGVQMATARAGFYKHERDDLLVMTFPEGASCAG